MRVFDLFDFDDTIHIMDVGASAIAETPIYKPLLEKEIGHLTAFDGDERQIKSIEDAYGRHNVAIINEFLFDGGQHSLYLCAPESGMTSIFKPKKEALEFFNGFSFFGKVHGVGQIQTTRLDDIADLPDPDFVKMDAQGAELGIIQNGPNKLEGCLALQLEVSYFALYENQPSFGEIDLCLRGLGFVPHRFIDVKRWSIAPTIFNDNFRVPGNQLLESDIIYVKDPLKVEDLNSDQIKKLAIIAHYAFKSFDLCVWFLLGLEKKGVLEPGDHRKYIENIKKFA